jgi:hypothetical protein
MPKPSACNDDRAIVVATFCWTTVRANVKWLVVDKAETKQVHELYAMPEAIEAARKGQPMPNGTVFTVVRNSAQLDAQGKPDDPNVRWY